MKILNCLLLLCLLGQVSHAQARYTSAQVHSHNDYAQVNPFFGAYQLRCGSIEADVFLQNGELMVAHTPFEIRPERTLKSLYLEPLQKEFQHKRGEPLQLLIDLKTASKPTLDTLVSQLRQYRALIAKRSRLKIVISGNMPPPTDFGQYPSWIYFDGRFTQTYSAKELKRVALFSMSFGSVGKWSTNEELSKETQQKALEWVQKAHQQGKKIRFWATPDTPQAWQMLQSLGADWIGTDNPPRVVEFLKN
ncbi:MAG: phosphatidylinositol-specific phospholipase C/glycerophosphodiester phosphodiesterase family protein [Spirosomaceae bacterium]|jgi:alkaline phosphatase|nr:phosphatidylinositol-specific phospholipase C/glycerophosphodiester phosphodiesterase family protein [Spirosomataceae bacterium]